PPVGNLSRMPFSCQTPSRLGPRHWGQSSARANTSRSSTPRAAAARIRGAWSALVFMGQDLPSQDQTFLPVVVSIVVRTGPSGERQGKLKWRPRSGAAFGSALPSLVLANVLTVFGFHLAPEHIV